MQVEQARILRQERLTEAHRVLVLECPDVAAAAQAGQFVHLLVPGETALTLRRPFSIYAVEPPSVSIMYKIVGKGTRAMDRLDTGDTASVMGPLGNGFPAVAAGAYPVLVAGGYGVAPLRLLAARSSARGLVMIGAKTWRDVLCRDEFEALGWEVRSVTEDGSAGEKGLVTQALADWLANRADGVAPELFACGPDGMLKAVCEVAASAKVTAWVSVERRMGCGVGACLACVVNVKDETGNVRRVRACREGPVFRGEAVVWE